MNNHCVMLLIQDGGTLWQLLQGFLNESSKRNWHLRSTCPKHWLLNDYF